MLESEPVHLRVECSRAYIWVAGLFPGPGEGVQEATKVCLHNVVSPFSMSLSLPFTFSKSMKKIFSSEDKPQKEAQ